MLSFLETLFFWRQQLNGIMLKRNQNGNKQTYRNKNNMLERRTATAEMSITKTRIETGERLEHHAETQNTHVCGRQELIAI